MNRSGKTFDGILPLTVPFQSAVILNPWNPSANGIVLPRKSGVALRLEPGQSIIIRTFTDRVVKGEPWVVPPADPSFLAIDGPWKIEYRSADLDRRKVPWKKFHEINFVNIELQAL